MKRQIINGTVIRRMSEIRSSNRVGGDEARQKVLRKTGGKVKRRITGIVAGVFLIFLLLQVLGIKPYIVLSGSMEPKIHTGSLCFVNTRVKYEQIQTGDVIAFVSPGGILVTHRVVAIFENGLETKGDANDVADGISTTKENFQGRTVFSIPCVGYGCYFLKQIFQVFAAAVRHIL